LIPFSTTLKSIRDINLFDSILDNLFDPHVRKSWNAIEFAKFLSFRIEKMSLFEISLEVIFVLVLGIVAEVGGLAKLFDLVNPFLRAHASPIPPRLVNSLNASFGANLQEVQKVSNLVLRKANPIELTRIDPTFPQLGVQVIPLLIFSNFSQNENLNALLKVCDIPFNSLGLELLTCGIQIIPPGVQTPFHQENYFGLLKYYLVLHGHEKASITIGGYNPSSQHGHTNQVHQLQTKSSLLFDPTVPLKIENLSRQNVHILCCEFRRPMSKLPDIINGIIMKIMSVSQPVMMACAQAWPKE